MDRGGSFSESQPKLRAIASRHRGARAGNASPIRNHGETCRPGMVGYCSMSEGIGPAGALREAALPPAACTMRFVVKVCGGREAEIPVLENEITALAKRFRSAGLAAIGEPVFSTMELEESIGFFLGMETALPTQINADGKAKSVAVSLLLLLLLAADTGQKRAGGWVKPHSDKFSAIKIALTYPLGFCLARTLLCIRSVASAVWRRTSP